MNARETAWHRLAFVVALIVGPTLGLGMPAYVIGWFSRHGFRDLSVISAFGLVLTIFSYVMTGVLLDPSMRLKRWAAWTWRRRFIAFAFAPWYVSYVLLEWVTRCLRALVRWILVGDGDDDA